MKHEEDHGETQADVLLEDPELGMTFDTENDVRVGNRPGFQAFVY